MTALTLNLSSIVGKIRDRELELLSRDNPDARLETDCQGHLISMSPTGSEASEKKFRSFNSNWNLE